jgi:hypothetical protein
MRDAFENFRAVALIAAIGLACPVWRATADEGAPASGEYESLLLALDPADGTLTGAEQADWVGNGTEKAPQFSCRFALRGAATAPGQYTISAWLPGDRIAEDRLALKGALAVKKGSVTVTLEQQPGGCQYLMIDSSFDADLVAKRAWRAVQIVKAPRAYFYATPSDKARQKSFVVRGDALGIVATQTDWAEVEYVKDDRVTHGWIRAGDLFPDHPDQ